MAELGRCPKRLLWLVVAVWAIPIIGCGGSTPIDPATADSLKGLAGLYVQYSMSHQNAGPPNEEALKKYARSLDTLALASAGVERARLDEYFISPRDKQPMHVLYGNGVTNLGRNAPMVAHEQTGLRGKKLAVYANNRIEELDDAGLKQVIEGKAPPG